MLNGETLQMNAIVSPDNAENKNLEWSVTNQTGSATISETGLLTATSYGTVEVTAKSKDGSGIVGSKVITINPVQVNSIDISGEQGKTKIFVGQTLQMNASVIPANAENKDISIYSLDGKMIFFATIKTNKYLVEVGSGVYIVNIDNTRVKISVR